MSFQVFNRNIIISKTYNYGSGGGFSSFGGLTGPSLFGCGFPQNTYVAPHCHDCSSGGGDGGLGKALLWGSAAGLGVGLLVKFHQPIGKFLGTVGKGIGKGATWVWNKALKPAGKGIANAGKWVWNNALKPAGQGIAKAGEWVWNKVLKPVGQGIANAAKWVWNGITGLFKKNK